METDWYDPDVVHDFMKLALVKGGCELVVWHGTGVEKYVQCGAWRYGNKRSDHAWSSSCFAVDVLHEGSTPRLGGDEIDG